ncbi:hypothetical protein [Blastococcus brunescens]|uniref:Uncharacterized protein n=1 Tax=Blastococcus brunescens TaxID=1564165 RepID=A0ABZ1B063_9ACTN|nr:hypothetical protein [Blastococcus sp. BMG 8361]WRL64160.1 hypothetical protein U6N30_32135 [Blastococcus sp. BMG 8361]
MTTTRRLGWTVVAPAAALVLTALCLRGPFAAVGPVLGDVGDELALSTGALAVVTSLPLVCFGLLSPSRRRSRPASGCTAPSSPAPWCSRSASVCARPAPSACSPAPSS